MRYTFGNILTEEMKKNKKIYCLVCDIGFGVVDKIREHFSERLINTGITEQATIGMASGMAQEGFIPVVYTITPFLLERPFEAIKLNIVQMNQNVKLVSYGDYPDLGPTHITSDLEGLCNCLKLPLIKPKTIEETIIETRELFTHKKPVFMFLSKAPK